MLDSGDKLLIASMITKAFALYDIGKLETRLIQKQVEYINDIKAMEAHLKKLGDNPANAIVKVDITIRTAALEKVLIELKKVGDARFKIEEHVL